MKKATGIISLVLVVAAVVMAVWFLPDDGGLEPKAVSAPPAPAKTDSSLDIPPAEPVVAKGEPEQATEVEEEKPDLPPGFTEEEAKRQQRILELRDAAQARWDETVETDQIDPKQIDPAVRKMFKTVQLEPVFDPENGREGFVDGMVISRLVGTNPLAEAGFKNGDRVTRWNGQPLQDPAQYAHLFASLGTRFEVCVERDGGEYCRMIDLSGS